MKTYRTLVGLILLFTISIGFLAGIAGFSVSANNTPQTLPFSQDWTTNLITANDNWSPVQGIEGFLGQDITTATGTDARTLLTTSAAVNDLDVIANQTNPNTLANGGVAEFDGIANPTIALQGSGTADAPHVVIYLNTTGQSNVRVAYNARDIDGSADNAIQQINTQYRIGSTGDFINVQGGYIADASTGPSTATLVTAVAVTLPAAANNQPVVQVRIMSTNAAGSDEWVGIDDISVTTVATPAPNRTSNDFNGDGRSDWAVTRNVGGQLRWFYNTNGTGAPTVALDWGLNGDFTLPEDYDGDGIDDIAVWRAGTPSNSYYYILQSQNNTVRIVNFGQTGDNPTVVGDYDGDGKADPAVYRLGPTADSQITWFYLASNNNPSNDITYVSWGLNSDRVTPGDFDGDGRNDFAIRRADGSQARFWINSTTTGIVTQTFGFITDIFVPGDYDGDGKTDLAVVRLPQPENALDWYYQPSSGGSVTQIRFGNSVQDYPAQGDYDGDGKTDIAVWRPGVFWIRNSSNAAVQNFQLGSVGDEPAGKYNYYLGP